MPTERELGFLEGMIEGEGYIGLNRANSRTCRRGFQWKPVLGVSNNNYELLCRVKRICDGGHIVKKGGGGFEYRINSNKMQEILPKLQLINKKRQSELILKAIDFIKQNKHRSMAEKSMNDTELELIQDTIKKLNCNKKPLRNRMVVT